MPRRPGSLWVASWIRHAEIDGARIILDLDRASYRLLNAVASAMWPAIVGDRSVSGMLEEVARDYEVSAAEVEQDFEIFKALCVEEGLLVSRQPSTMVEPPKRLSSRQRERPVRFYVLAALRSLVAARWSLARSGLRAVYERYALVPVGDNRIGLPAAMAAFRVAEQFYVSARAPDDCLARSLALFRYLRVSGFPASHVIGVRRIPFRAHAWVECGGEVLIDRQTNAFVPLAVLAPALTDARQ